MRLIRDEIHVTQELLGSAAGAPLQLAARRIVISGDVKSFSSELTLMTDELEAAGWIDASGSWGAAVKDGDPGANGTPDPNIGELRGSGDPAGYDGQPGGRGNDGTPGRVLRIYARSIKSLGALYARGGNGGHGGDGGDGGNGVASNYWHGYGGSGKNGGDGGDGKPGGDVIVVASEYPVFTIDVSGGKGGRGGARGRAGWPTGQYNGYTMVGPRTDNRPTSVPS